MSKQNRMISADNANKKFTNVFVKNFGEFLDDEGLRDMFSRYGDITSVKVGKTPDGKPAGFGFVNFKEADEAYRVISIHKFKFKIYLRYLNFCECCLGSARG